MNRRPQRRRKARKASRRLALACTVLPPRLCEIHLRRRLLLPGRRGLLPPPSARSALLSRIPHRRGPLLFLLPRRCAPPLLPRRRRALRGRAALLRPSAPIATPSRRPPRPVLLPSPRPVPPPPPQATAATRTHRSVHSDGDPPERHSSSDPPPPQERVALPQVSSRSHGVSVRLYAVAENGSRPPCCFP
ncbi:hypothetical protein PVAP13_9NG492470 [Panicum virgatum]|uniref:Uncharacterized protein n=1 Tax=Panicum virgatum TaxID=38727 RepID=A0A8T0MRG5_PANVG|nr:hypothetical protein PVAP13_9NG492470 [Panicum virgatum]